MNKVIFNHVVAEIASAAARTYLRVRFEGVECGFNGRCSPYVSHQTVEFAQLQHPYHVGMLEIETRDGGILAVPLSSVNEPSDLRGEFLRTEEQKEHFEVERVIVPIALFRSLLRDLNRETGGWIPVIDEPGLCWVIVVRRKLVGFDAEGRPILSGVERKPVFRGTVEHLGLPVTLEHARAAGLCESGVREWVARRFQGRTLDEVGELTIRDVIGADPGNEQGLLACLVAAGMDPTAAGDAIREGTLDLESWGVARAT